MEWSDGTELEDADINPNWYKGIEPNDPNEKCVGISTKRERWSGGPEGLTPDTALPPWLLHLSCQRKLKGPFVVM